MDDKDQGQSVGKRTDVGYRRPPVEHQFKAGQKPPPRKKRANQVLSSAKLLATILAEKRRVKRGAQVCWYPTGYLIVEAAFQLAEEGNQTVGRALTEYLMAADPPESTDVQQRIELDPEGPPGVFNYIRWVRD